MWRQREILNHSLRLVCGVYIHENICFSGPIPVANLYVHFMSLTFGFTYENCRYYTPI